MEIDKDEPPVTSREAAEALRILQRYIDQSANAEMQQMCDEFDDMLANERAQKLKQKKMDDYFVVK